MLNEVQYSTLSLRGTGTHTDKSFSVVRTSTQAICRCCLLSTGICGQIGCGSQVAPWDPTIYNGWGIIMKANCNSNTIVQTHCEGSGGCVLIQGPGNFENQWTTAVM